MVTYMNQNYGVVYTISKFLLLQIAIREAVYLTEVYTISKFLLLQIVEPVGVISMGV